MTMERWRPGWGLLPWRPLREPEETERWFEEVFGRPLIRSWRRLTLEEKGWVPPIELIEKEDKFVVKAELPGMTKEEIDVSVMGDTLIIKGERKAETEAKEENYYCCERSYGSFFRSITMPSAVDAKKIKATYEDGVLEIALPKVSEVKPKKIEIGIKSGATS
jgi:HSP20 family protein